MLLSDWSGPRPRGRPGLPNIFSTPLTFRVMLNENGWKSKQCEKASQVNDAAEIRVHSDCSFRGMPHSGSISMKSLGPSDGKDSDGVQARILEDVLHWESHIEG